MALINTSLGKSLGMTIGTIVLFLTFLASVSFVASPPSIAITESNSYYTQLNQQSQKFYDVLYDMYNKGNLKSGNYEFDLIDNEVVSIEQLKAYEEGNDALIQDLDIAKTAFSLDYNVFYVDFDKIGLSIGTKDNVYVATLGTGRNDNYLRTYFNNQVDSSIEEYEASLESLIAGIENKVASVEQISEINSAILSKVSFGYSFDGESSSTQKNALADTNYGALVLGSAVYEGYARILKDVLDSFDYKNMLVRGYVLNENETYQPAMWNYVQVNNLWYAINIGLNAQSDNPEEFLLVGADKMKYRHLVAEIACDDSKNFTVPTLNSQDYGYIEGIEYNLNYQDNLIIEASYLNKNATDLSNMGYYLALSTSTIGSTLENIVWDNWIAVSLANIDNSGEYFGSITDSESSTSIIISNDIPFVRLAILDFSPDDSTGIYGSIDEENISIITPIITNEKNSSYISAPTVKKVAPQLGTTLSADRAYTFVIEYDEPLVKVADTEEAGVKVTISRGDRILECSNFFWNGAETITFDFTPSALYNDNFAWYTFSVVNLVGSKSRLVPENVTYYFQKDNISVSTLSTKWGDGNVLGLAKNNNLDLSKWTLGDSYTVSNTPLFYREVALVSSQVSMSIRQEIIDKILLLNENLNSNDILKSQCYSASLSLGGELVNLNGHTINIFFPNAEQDKSYLVYVCPQNADNTLDLNNMKLLNNFIYNDKIIVETSEFGIFMCLAVDKNKINSDTHSILVNNLTGNGKAIVKMNSSVLTDIVNLNLDQSIIVEFSPDNDYILDFCLINGEEIEVKDNQIVLSYNNIKESNVLDCAFVSNRVANYESTLGVDSLFKSNIKNQYSIPSTNLALIICVICSIIVVVGLILTYIVLRVIDFKKDKKLKYN